MKKSLLLIAALAALLQTSVVAKDKKPIDWHTGTLLDSATERGSKIVGDKDGITELRRDNAYYQIDDGEKYVYVVRRSMTNRRDKPLPLTVNGPVQFALDGNDLLLLDEKGKQHRLAIEKKILKSAH